MRQFRTFCHNCWNVGSSPASGLCTEWSGWKATRLQAGNAALAARAKAAEGEAARVQARLAKVENQLDRFRAE
ncbi:hypothetical protein [Methylobacterium sp. CCH5-D2]|uniref:hypothetical protein n=1 Tax=Methylobacterium sp. CCH5-D2 TaxID=1768765 RepID=UPI000ABB7FC0|nr:hypothetical protein [Methylobacterium sp. CCH5-D2]